MCRRRASPMQCVPALSVISPPGAVRVSSADPAIGFRASRMTKAVFVDATWTFRMDTAGRAIGIPSGRGKERRSCNAYPDARGVAAAPVIGFRIFMLSNTEAASASRVYPTDILPHLSAPRCLDGPTRGGVCPRAPATSTRAGTEPPFSSIAFPPSIRT